MSLQRTLLFTLIIAVGAPIAAQSASEHEQAEHNQAQQAAATVTGKIASVDPRVFGDEPQIRKRERWFWERRGVDVSAAKRMQTSEYRALREAAVDQINADVGFRSAKQAKAGQSWTSMGPDGMTMLNWTMSPVSGRVAALAVHPSNDQIIYLGAASGGVWKTSNGGSSWSSLLPTLGTVTIGSVWLEPGDPNKLWVGTGERNNACIDYFGRGLFYSPDGGTTFSSRNGSGTSALQLSYITSISTNPTDQNIVLAGGTGVCLSGGASANGGLFRTLDKGATWTKVVTGAVEDAFYSRSNTTIAYAAVGRNGVIKSTDYGLNWSRLGVGMPTASNIGVVRAAIAQSNSNILYALVNDATNSVTDLYKTSNAGASWAIVRSNVCEGQCAYNLTIDVDPSNANKVLIGSIRPAISTDGGANFTNLTTTWGASQSVHQDVHVVRFSKATSNRLWVGSDGGLWRSDNNGSNFSNLNTNLATTQFYDIAVHPSTADRIWGGAQDNSSIGRFGNQRWDVTQVTGDGFMNLVDTGNPNIVFQFGYIANGIPQIWRSTTGGNPNSFSGLNMIGFVANEPYGWVVPATSAAGFAFVGSHSVYRAPSAQVGTFAWTKIANNLTGGSQISAMTPVRKLASDPLTLYVGSMGGRIYRLWDVLSSATPATRDVTANYPGGVVSDIAVDPTDFNRIYVTRSAFGGSKVYRSTDFGVSWSAVGSGLPDVPANSVAVDPANGARVFVATDVGVYESTDAGANFVSFNSGMPTGVVATDLEVQNANRYIYLGTYGRGAWRVSLN